MKLYEALSGAIGALDRLRKGDTAGNPWGSHWEDRVSFAVKEFLPSGSGFDIGTQLIEEKSNAEKLYFLTSFHHMDDGGGYDGWTDHTITVTPSFHGGFNLRISGRDRNQIKEYIADTFGDALNTDIEWTADNTAIAVSRRPDPLPVAVVDKEALLRPIMGRFPTIEAAEQWLAEREALQGDKVRRGGFGIDAPEAMVNPKNSA